MVEGMSSQPIALTDLSWTFGDRIRKIRRLSGESQASFAAAIGQGEKAVGAWELGTNEPRNVVTIARRIELRYGIPAAWTLGLTEEPPNPGGWAHWESNPEPAGSPHHLATVALFPVSMPAEEFTAA